MAEARYWVNTVSRDHVQKGVEGGFTQADHGKNTRLKRLNQGDYLVFYSPRTHFRSGETLQAFTALGRDYRYRAVSGGYVAGLSPVAAEHDVFGGSVKRLYARLSSTCPLSKIKRAGAIRFGGVCSKLTKKTSSELPLQWT